MTKAIRESITKARPGAVDGHQEDGLFDTATLQNAIFDSEYFSSIATDAKGVIQIFNVGAERMLGYTAAEVVDRITPAEISDPQELIARARELSVELDTPITPGFDALVFKASREIEDIYELTYIRKDGSRFPAVVSVTALRDAQDAILGFLLIGTDNTARQRAEDALAKAGAISHRLRHGTFAGEVRGPVDPFMGGDRPVGNSGPQRAPRGPAAVTASVEHLSQNCQPRAGRGPRINCRRERRPGGTQPAPKIVTIIGSTTVSASIVAMAESTALPPAMRISVPVTAQAATTTLTFHSLDYGACGPALAARAPLGRLRGRPHHLAQAEIPVIVTYHPAYLLRSPGDKRKAWEDLCLARRIVAEKAAA